MEENEKIIQLIKNGYECEYLDFKAKQYNKENNSDLLKDIMAMANSNYLGDKYIIIGIKCRPNGEKEIMGISDDQFIDVSIYQQIVMDNIEPEIKFDYTPLKYEDKLIGVLKVHEQNSERPYMAKKQNQGLHIGQCYIRKGANNTNAVRRDFDEFYSLKEKFELKILQNILSATYLNEACAGITIAMRNYTKLPVVIMSGELIVCNQEGQPLTIHPVYGFDDKIVGVDFKLSFMPMEEKCGDLFVGFSSADCIKLGLDEDGVTDERFTFILRLYDSNGNEYIAKIDDGFVFAKGDFLWKVKLKNKNENNKGEKFSLKKFLLND